MNNLIFCLNATIPIFLTMLLGVFFRYAGLFDQSFVNKMNRFVFTAAIPALLFHDLSGVPFRQVWDSRFVLFCFLTTAVCIAICCGLSFFVADRSIRGEFAQAGYRSSATILGISLIQNLYGNAGMAPLMIVSSVPLYNAAAVLILELMGPDRKRPDQETLNKTLKNLLTNPIILGIGAGILWSLSGLSQPRIMELTVQNLAATATPLGLMVMGASFDAGKTLKKWRPVLAASALKLVGFTAVFLPLAVRMGFHDDKLVAILVMLGSSTTVSCFVMARGMGHDGTVTAGAIMLTTFFSAFTLTVWLFILRSMGLI